MTDHKMETLESATPTTELDVGKPVAWMVDPDQRDKILGVTYEFSQTGERKTVWYTANKRRPRRLAVVTVTHLQQLETS
jgi:hypothetical protein